MAVTIIPRGDWGSMPPRDDDTLPPSSRRGVVIHWNGPKMPQPQHSGCDDLVRSIQRYHMVNKGWTDGAYSFVACQHGVIYELRGWHRYQFANGSLTPPAGTGDYTLAPSEHWYTVMVLTGGDHDSAGRIIDEQKPSAALLRALAELVEEARRRGAGRAVKPHRAFRVKTCPGDTLAAYCARWDGHPTGTPIKEDDVTQEEVEAALRKVLRLPESGLAVPYGQLHNGQMYVHLLNATRGGLTAATAARTLSEAIRADQSVQGAQQDKLLALAAEIEADLPEPEPTPEVPA